MALLGGSREAASLPASPSAPRPLPSAPSRGVLPSQLLPPYCWERNTFPVGNPSSTAGSFGLRGADPSPTPRLWGGGQMVGHGIAPPGLVGV